MMMIMVLNDDYELYNVDILKSSDYSQVSNADARVSNDIAHVSNAFV
jgi:hypothetical protein